MEDFIPEGKEQIGAKSLFVDFIPAPTLKEIKDFDLKAKARAEAKEKKKEKVVLTEQQIADFKAMEEETAEEREINGETPIEPVVEENKEETAEVESENSIEAKVEPVESAEPTTDTPMPNFHKNKNKRAGKRR